jgi:hypothetical protein
LGVGCARGVAELLALLDVRALMWCGMLRLLFILCELTRSILLGLGILSVMLLGRIHVGGCQLLGSKVNLTIRIGVNRGLGSDIVDADCVVGVAVVVGILGVFLKVVFLGCEFLGATSQTVGDGGEKKADTYETDNGESARDCTLVGPEPAMKECKRKEGRKSGEKPTLGQ